LPASKSEGASDSRWHQAVANFDDAAAAAGACLPKPFSLRDAKLYEIGAGTSEIRRWLIGRELFEETQ
jgi:hypothetical protein